VCEHPAASFDKGPGLSYLFLPHGEKPPKLPPNTLPVSVRVQKPPTSEPAVAQVTTMTTAAVLAPAALCFRLAGYVRDEMRISRVL